jgi:SnoaL-like domain
VRSICAAWERGDFSSAEWAHPDIEFVRADGFSPGTWHGLAGMAEGWRERLAAFDEMRLKVNEYRELDAERVLVMVHLSGRGKTSGLELREVGAKGAAVFHIGDETVIKVVLYTDLDNAFAELGLEPRG